jgi:hypothetical protein
MVEPPPPRLKNGSIMRTLVAMSIGIEETQRMERFCGNV